MKHIITIFIVFSSLFSLSQYIDVNEAYKYEPDYLLQDAERHNLAAGQITETPNIYIYIYIGFQQTVCNII